MRFLRLAAIPLGARLCRLFGLWPPFSECGAPEAEVGQQELLSPHFAGSSLTGSGTFGLFAWPCTQQNKTPLLKAPGGTAPPRLRGRGRLQVEAPQAALGTVPGRSSAAPAGGSAGGPALVSPPDALRELS